MDLRTKRFLFSADSKAMPIFLSQRTKSINASSIIKVTLYFLHTFNKDKISWRVSAEPVGLLGLHKKTKSALGMSCITWGRSILKLFFSVVFTNRQFALKALAANSYSLKDGIGIN